MKENTCPRTQLDVRAPVFQRAQQEGELSRLRTSLSSGLKTIICQPQNKPKTIQIKGKTNQNKPKSNQNKCFFQAQSNASYAQKFRILFSFPAKQLPVVLRSQRAIRPIAIGPIAVGRTPPPALSALRPHHQDSLRHPTSGVHRRRLPLSGSPFPVQSLRVLLSVGLSLSFMILSLFRISG